MNSWHLIAHPNRPTEEMLALSVLLSRTSISTDFVYVPSAGPVTGLFFFQLWLFRSASERPLWFARKAQKRTSTQQTLTTAQPTQRCCFLNQNVKLKVIINKRIHHCLNANKGNKKNLLIMKVIHSEQKQRFCVFMTFRGRYSSIVVGFLAYKRC